jgi:ribbon-helix-helix CopG family protein
VSDSDQNWEQEEVEVERPVGVVVSARLSQELADRVFAEAQRRGVPTSAVVREALELLLEDGTIGSSLDLVISSADAPVAFFTGRSGVGRTGAAPAEVEITQNPAGQMVLKA